MLLKNFDHTTKKRTGYFESSVYLRYDAVFIGKDLLGYHRILPSLSKEFISPETAYYVLR
jgi:hypothetical protein